MSSIVGGCLHPGFAGGLGGRNRAVHKIVIVMQMNMDDYVGDCAEHYPGVAPVAGNCTRCGCGIEDVEWSEYCDICYDIVLKETRKREHSSQ